MDSSSRVPSGREERLMLAFDAGCVACGGMAASVEEAADDRLEVISLDDPVVRRWRRQALGDDAPWAPTLIEVKGESVKAWTGLKMGVVLTKKLGLSVTWRIMQVLGESRSAPGTGRAHGPTRGQFIKGAAGAAAALTILPATEALASASTSGSNTGVNGLRSISSNVPAVGQLKQFRSVKKASANFGTLDWSKVQKGEYEDASGSTRAAYIVPIQKPTTRSSTEAATSTTVLVADDESELGDANGIVMEVKQDARGRVRSFTYYQTNGSPLGTLDIKNGGVVVRQPKAGQIQARGFRSCFIACAGSTFPRPCIRACLLCRAPVACAPCLACAGYTGVRCAARCLRR